MSIHQAQYKQNTIQRLGMWAVVVLLLMLIPLVLTLLNPQASINGGTGGGWDWTGGDFIFAFVVLFGAAVAYELVAKRIDNMTYKIAVGLAVGASLLLIWVNAAVGIIGENNGFNLIYLGIVFIGLIGSIIARFRPQGMARTLFVMAVAQMAVPVIALFIAPNIMREPPGVIGVFALNVFFATLFVGSALLFQRVERKQQAIESKPTA